MTVDLIMTMVIVAGLSAVFGFIIALTWVNWVLSKKEKQHK